MRIEAMSVYRIALQLTDPLRTATGTHAVRDAILVHAQSDGESGWGENVATAESFYVAEHAGSSIPKMIDVVIPAVLAHDVARPEELVPLLQTIDGFEMAKYGVEMAATDLWLRQESCSLASYIGATRTQIDAGVVVGLYDSLSELERVVQGYVEDGYKRIKIKIAPGHDIEVVRAVRGVVGSQIALQVDANRAYTIEDVSHLQLLDEFGLQFIEQPFGTNAFVEHAVLAKSIDTPVCLDESLITLNDLHIAITEKACTFVNIKPARVGSMFLAISMYKKCIEHGLVPWCGGMLESGIGRAAVLAFAGLPGFTITHDLSASERYFAHDVTTPFALSHGQLTVPEGPGIGVRPLESVIETAELLAHVTR
jgi:o-succinylbenzoate synthase